MKLIYRGTSFDYNPSKAVGVNMGRPTRPHHASLAPYTLIYRGQTLQVDPTQSAEEVMPRAYELTYRGEKYYTNGVAQATPERRVSVPATLPCQYIGKVHQANLQENLQRRLKAAQEKGDQQLVTLLQEEQQQITA
ncbi:MAG: DUF4278 domain-containing protein [Timaviella obliquedivisa GSE-PSE-MK23-08B]|jgi:hypothetical protein|nr:DUF4278 domain-containing protein [Timaviella obliquedivisa GSE-PSE-MK23-08B]